MLLTNTQITLNLASFVTTPDVRYMRLFSYFSILSCFVLVLMANILCRDGVSEGQFYQVLLYELDAIRKVRSDYH